jgi:hypothetical protein
LWRRTDFVRELDEQVSRSLGVILRGRQYSVGIACNGIDAKEPALIAKVFIDLVQPRE